MGTAQCGLVSLQRERARATQQEHGQLESGEVPSQQALKLVHAHWPSLSRVGGWFLEVPRPAEALSLQRSYCMAFHSAAWSSRQQAPIAAEAAASCMIYLLCPGKGSSRAANSYAVAAAGRRQIMCEPTDESDGTAGVWGDVETCTSATHFGSHFDARSFHSFPSIAISVPCGRYDQISI
jgi:hypothetical protein